MDEKMVCVPSSMVTVPYDELPTTHVAVKRELLERIRPLLEYQSDGSSQTMAEYAACITAIRALLSQKGE